MTGSTNAISGPSGYSYGLLMVRSNGTVVLSGSLSDGTALTASGPISKNGRWPFYAPLCGGKGSLLSWLSFSGGSFTGNPFWFKNPVSTGAYYRNGFNLSSGELYMNGSLYVSPPKGIPVLNLINGVATFFDGNLASSFTNHIAITNNVLSATSGTNHLKALFNPTSGLFSGTFVHPVTHKTSSFNGAVLSAQNTGYGYFLGTNQSGKVLIDNLGN